MMRITIVLLALLLTARNDEGSPAVPAPISHWKIVYSPNMPAWMSGTEGNWYFDFPNQNGVHYVYKVAPAIRVGQTITMHFAITGKGNFVPTEGTATARVRLFLQQRGDTLTAQEPYKRWWSVTYVELHEGEFTLTASLSPDEFKLSWHKTSSMATSSRIGAHFVRASMPLLGQIFRQGLFDEPAPASILCHVVRAKPARGARPQPMSHSSYMGSFG